MQVTVWSVLSGKVSGHLVMNVSPSHTVGRVLNTFCNHKGVTHSESYILRNRDNLVLSPSKTLKQVKVEEGEILTLDLMEDEQQTFAFGSWWMVTVASFTIGMIGIVVVCWLFWQPTETPQKYGIVVDAGSSHSEVFLFNWDADMPQGTADVKLLHRCLLVGGITHYATHSSAVGDYFEQCMSEAEQLVPASYHPTTPLYVGATAGMRILRDFEEKEVDDVFTSLRTYLKTNTTFQVDDGNVRILSGFEEGASGWIAASYLLDVFRQTARAPPVTLDVGGASLQVSSEGSSHTSTIKLFNHTYGVQSKSFLCYGVHEAFHRYTYLLFLNTSSEPPVSPSPAVDPCLAGGVTRHLPQAEIAGPCTLTSPTDTPDLSSLTNVDLTKLMKIFKKIKVTEKDKLDGANTYNVEKSVQNNSLVMQGSSNALGCEAGVRQLFDHHLCKSTFTYGDCMMNHSLTPLNTTLIAFSELFQHIKTLLHIGPNVTLDQFKKEVYDVCSLEAESLYTTYPDLDKEMAEDLCFDSMYVYILLTVGLGINNVTWPHVQFTSEVGKSEVVWPQGFMINRTSSFLPVQAPAPTLTLVTFTLLLLLFFVFLLSSALFLHHSRKISTYNVSYQRCDQHEA